jgi:hypothetical protein
MWFTVSIAVAAVPVVQDGADGAAAVLQVAERTGLPATQLVPQKLDELLAADPAVLGDGAIRRCSKTQATNLELQAEIVRAESAWTNERDGGAAMDHLDRVVAEMGCLSELIDGKVAADAFALRGGVAAELGDLDLARSELRTALDFVPDLLWAPRWPASGQALLEEQRGVAMSATVTVSPDDASAGPWLDGTEIRDGRTVTAGLHLFQYGTPSGIHSAWVTVGGDVQFVVPTNYKRPVLERIVDPAGQAEVEALLRASIPQFQAAYVVSNGGIWLVAAEGAGVTTTELSPPPPPAPETGKKPKKPKR